MSDNKDDTNEDLVHAAMAAANYHERALEMMWQLPSDLHKYIDINQVQADYEAAVKAVTDRMLPETDEPHERWYAGELCSGPWEIHNETGVLIASELSEPNAKVIVDMHNDWSGLLQLRTDVQEAK